MTGPITPYDQRPRVEPLQFSVALAEHRAWACVLVLPECPHRGLASPVSASYRR
jgi:hypothetical protein